jgi:hypothetical protein
MKPRRAVAPTSRASETLAHDSEPVPPSRLLPGWDPRLCCQRHPPCGRERAIAFRLTDSAQSRQQVMHFVQPAFVLPFAPQFLQLRSAENALQRPSGERQQLRAAQRLPMGGKNTLRGTQFRQISISCGRNKLGGGNYSTSFVNIYVCIFSALSCIS